MSELDEIPFGKEFGQFSKYCEDNYKNIVINESELENFKNKLFPKGIEYGLPGWMSLMVIKQHIEKHAIVMPVSSKKVNLNKEKETNTSNNFQNLSAESIENSNESKQLTTVQKIEEEVSINVINLYFKDEIYGLVVDEAESAEKVNPQFFQNSIIADKYLRSLMNTDLEKAVLEIERVLEIAKDKTKILFTAASIFTKKGEKSKDIKLLKKGLEYYQSYNFSDLEIKTKRINYVQKLISEIELDNQFEKIGLSRDFIEFFKENEYVKIFKVSCYLSEPQYARGNKSIDKWVDSNLTFFIPAKSAITDKNAVAFLKANWDKYRLFRSDSNWRSKGYLYDYYDLVSFDKRKIEVFEFYEILIDK